MHFYRTCKLVAGWAALLVVVCGTFMYAPRDVQAYPLYTGNANTVPVAPADGATAGTGNVGGIPTAREFLTVEQKYRIRQTGSITKVRFYTATTSGLTGFYVKIWRKNGSNYDLVATSENLLSGMSSATTSTITLTTPLAVQEGDYIGYRIEGSGSSYTLYAISGQFGGTYYVSNTVPSATNYNWSGNSYLNGQVVPIEVQMTAPQAVFIGDSIIAGHPGHYSFLEGSSSTTNIASTIEKQFSDLTGYTYQNMGIGSQVTSQLAARFNANVLALKPKIVVIEGGVNDIAGAVSKSTFLANWTSMLDAAQADSGITTIIVLKILPWTGGSNANMQTRDDWNASLATLAAGYSKAIVVDASSYVGQFRAGGDAGNLWNQQAAYNSGDNIHYNAAGHGQIAQAIADALPKPSATFDNDFVTWNSGNVSVNYNLIQTGNSAMTNISQTGTSGIEYSTDGVSWSDATQGSGGDGMTGLASSAAPGTDHVFVWNSTADLGSTEDASVYLRIRPNDGTSSALAWVTSSPFGIDSVAPSSVGAPSFGTVTTTSIQVVKPSAVTENGSGLYQWQARRNSATQLGYNGIATVSVTDTGLSANTQYSYDASFSDSRSNVSSFGAQASKYTLIGDPTNVTAVAASNSVTVSADAFVNDTSGSSGYYFSRSGGGSSGWVQSNSWSESGLSCGTAYSYSVKYRNGDGVETNPVSVGVTTATCGSSGIGPVASQTPSAPAGGFAVAPAQGSSVSASRTVSLRFNAGDNVKRMAISLTGDFSDSVLEEYMPVKEIDLCSRFGGYIKSPVCPNGTYTVYVRFYTDYGISSSVISTTVTLSADGMKPVGTSCSTAVGSQLIGCEAGIIAEATPQELNRGRTAAADALAAKIVPAGTASEIKDRIAYFIANGTSLTKPLGAGERGGIVNSFLSAHKRLPSTEADWEDIIKLSTGRWPGQRSETAENRASLSFRSIYGRSPDMKNANDSAAIMMMAYGMRPVPRNPDKEAAAIKIYRSIFNRQPSFATAWDAVRAIGFSGATR